MCLGVWWASCKVPHTELCSETNIILQAPNPTGVLLVNRQTDRANECNWWYSGALKVKKQLGGHTVGDETHQHKTNTGSAWSLFTSWARTAKQQEPKCLHSSVYEWRTLHWEAERKYTVSLTQASWSTCFFLDRELVPPHFFFFFFKARDSYSHGIQREKWWYFKIWNNPLLMFYI